MTYTAKDGAETWIPNMPPPSSFDRAAYQKRIDDIVGTRDGRPIVKLAWAPQEFRWHPYALPGEPKGYTFPIFCIGRDKNGELLSPPRWVLLQRAEPQHYAHTWEATRFGVHEGQVWDWRGPCPPERYTELRAHCYHDGECCPCHSETCECGEEYAHCWGKYLDPNDSLLDWIRKANQESQADSDVKPNEDVRYFAAPNAQQDAVNAREKAEKNVLVVESDIEREMNDFWFRKPKTINLKRTDSGIILLN